MCGEDNILLKVSERGPSVFLRAGKSGSITRHRQILSFLPLNQCNRSFPLFELYINSSELCRADLFFKARHVGDIYSPWFIAQPGDILHSPATSDASKMKRSSPKMRLSPQTRVSMLCYCPYVSGFIGERTSSAAPRSAGCR